MDNEAFSAPGVLHMVPRLFPSLGPALLIAVGYVDPGKWAAAVDGGARFGFDLVLLVLAFNCTAILCQYLAARIAVVTGKNLAQICREEYNGYACMMLGFQAELSAVALDLTMILGIAHGLNLLFGLDLFTCIFLTAIDAVLFPIFVTLLEKCKMDMLFISISGFALLFYILGVLISQPEIPLVMNGIFPRLRGESAYSLMSLLGASIMPHNFYLHSSIVQQQQKPPSVSTGALCHDHFFAILFIFSGIFLVNYVVMFSAATFFNSAGLAVLTLQDTLLLTEQIFQSRIVRFAFFLVLFFSSQVTALTWNLGGQVLLHDFFGVSLPVWNHRVAVKALAIIPTLYCAYNSGAEGIYQLLIFSQVLLAILLPSSVIPLFRVASSRSIMGDFKISWFVEMLALTAFLGMLAPNIIFIVEMLFGDSDWIGNLKWNMGSSMTFLYTVLLLTACASVMLILWLAVMPLKSANDRLDIHSWHWDLQRAMPEVPNYREENQQLLNTVLRHDDNEYMAEEEALEKSVVSHSDNSAIEYDHDLPETILESDPEPLQPAVGENCNISSSSPEPLMEESRPAIDLAPVAALDEASTGGSLDAAGTLQVTGAKEPVEKTVELVRHMQATAKDDAVDVWEFEESTAGIPVHAPSPTSEGPGSFKSISGKSDDGFSGTGSLSRLSGLGRAARRQFAATLDEFWGQLYDFYGQLTPEAKAKRMDVILGLESKPTSVKPDITGTEYDIKYFSEADRRPFPSKSMDYDSSKQQRMLGSLESSYGVPMGSSSWSSYSQLLDAYAQSSNSNRPDASERRYFSLRLPSYSEERDSQPATIHGYQIASHLNQIAADRNTGSLNILLDPSTPKSAMPHSNYIDALRFRLGQNELGSLHASSMQNSAASVISRLQAERPYYDSSLVGASGDVGSSLYPKKYCSLPDISGLALSSRNSSSTDRNTQWTGAIGPWSSGGRISCENSLYSTPASRAEGSPLVFDELSPSKLYRDLFSLPASSSLETRSLWSRQPDEQLFGIAGRPQAERHEVLQETSSAADSGTKMLQSLRYCIMKLLKLDASDWLFRKSGGFDEELIDRVAARECFLYEAEARGANWKFGSSKRNEDEGLAKFLVSSVPYCGEGCIWQIGLIVSFGVWCIHRILELSLLESRPELWGKYTFVLNRLQGILDPAFSKPRPLISPCLCLQIPATYVKGRGPLLPNGLSSHKRRPTSASTLLDLIKDVETAVSGRKGPTGTAAGDVAFPKGKENLASVLNRYKRRLSNKSIGMHEGRPSGSRKVLVPTAVSFNS